MEGTSIILGLLNFFWDKSTSPMKKIFLYAGIGLFFFITSLYIFAFIFKHSIPYLGTFILVVSLLAGGILSIYWILVLLIDRWLSENLPEIKKSDKALSPEGNAQTKEK